MRVLVHGATGAQGLPVVRRLLSDGHTVRALTRSDPAAGSRGPSGRRLPAGVEPVVADLTDVDDLAAAYDGVEAAVLVLPGGAPPDRAVAQAETILTALARAAVPRAVFNTSGAVWSRPPGIPFLDARTRLAAGLPGAVPQATLVAPAAGYLENFSERWLVRHLLSTGELLQTAPPDAVQTPVAMADIADAVARALTEDAPPARIVVAGPSPVTGTQVAAALAAHLARPVRWTAVPPQTYLQGVARGLGAQYAANIGALYGPGADVPAPDAPPPGTRHVTGRLDLVRWIPTQDWT